MIKTFKGDYDRGEFYSFMGKFFAEKEYKKTMPYLINESNRVWFVIIHENKVVAFINYLDKLGILKIGDYYIDDEIEDKDLMEHNLITLAHNQGNGVKDMYVDIEKGGNKEEYIRLGFEVYKETDNYWCLIKKANRVF